MAPGTRILIRATTVGLGSGLTRSLGWKEEQMKLESCPLRQHSLKDASKRPGTPWSESTRGIFCPRFPTASLCMKKGQIAGRAGQQPGGLEGLTQRQLVDAPQQEGRDGVADHLLGRPQVAAGGGGV